VARGRGTSWPDSIIISGDAKFTPFVFSSAQCNSQSIAELRVAQNQIHQWYIEYSDDIQESSCGEIVDFSFIGGGSGSMSRGDILLHVIPAP
jgi:hypothetical protein